MPDLDAELLEKVERWCAQSGRPAGSAEIRRALEDLGWDELLAVRALLADPPPAQPLGPFALADLARGVSPETAAEREREGHYPEPGEVAPAGPAAGEDAAAPAPRKGSTRAPRSSGPVIRRARDVPPPVLAAPPAAPLLEELLLPEGRAVLERLVRHHGARRQALLTDLAAGWRTPDGRRPADADLERLLDHHGLARTFARRERDELLHALRAASGLRSGAAARLGIDREALDAALARAGVQAEAERIREPRRAEVRAKATLAERVRVLLTDPARLEDLGLLAEVEEDLRRRLPEHVRAVSAAGGRVIVALAESLSIAPAEAFDLLQRLGLPVDGGGAPGAGAPPARTRPRPSGLPGGTGGLHAPLRPSAGRSAPGQRPDRRGPPRPAGTFAGASERPRGAPERGPGSRRPAAGGGFGAPRPKGERREGGFGPPRERRPPTGGGFGTPRPKGERREGGFGPPRERRPATGGGYGTPRPKGERREGGFGPPRERRPAPGAAPGPRRPGSRPGGGGVPQRKGPRPGGGRRAPRGPRGR